MRDRIVRVNGLATAWGADDVAAIRGAKFDAVLLPKVETPRGVLNAQTLAVRPCVKGFVMGTNDLAMELGCRIRADRMALMTNLGQCLLAARARGIVAIDGVCNAFRDQAGHD